MDSPDGASGEEPASQCRLHRDTGLISGCDQWGWKESDMTEAT